MTLEKLQERLKNLEVEKIQMISTYDGAIQDCKYWIDSLTPKEEVTND